MKLVAKKQMAKLLEIGKRPNEDFLPVVKIFTLDANTTRLLQVAS